MKVNHKTQYKLHCTSSWANQNSSLTCQHAQAEQSTENSPLVCKNVVWAVLKGNIDVSAPVCSCSIQTKVPRRRRRVGPSPILFVLTGLLEKSSPIYIKIYTRGHLFQQASLTPPASDFPIPRRYSFYILCDNMCSPLPWIFSFSLALSSMIEILTKVSWSAYEYQ